MNQYTLVVKSADEITSQALLTVLKARVKVFVIEQNCPYQEVDDQDDTALHVMLMDGDRLVAYTRIIPHLDGQHMSFGRVMVVKEYRGRQLGRQIVTQTLAILHDRYPGAPIKIQAQNYLRQFYGSFGFQPVSDVYLEDDIPHVDMVLEH